MQMFGLYIFGFKYNLTFMFYFYYILLPATFCGENLHFLIFFNYNDNAIPKQF